jgi:glycosyltransferase involved in cell wall biosynthesis
MRIALADLHWEGHHTPYAKLLIEYLLESGHNITFITDNQNPHLNEYPDSNLFKIDTVSVPESVFDGGSIPHQVIRYIQISRVCSRVNFDQNHILHILNFDSTIIPYRILSLHGSYSEMHVIATLHRDAFTGTVGEITSQNPSNLISAYCLETALNTGALDCMTVHTRGMKSRLYSALNVDSESMIRTVPAPTKNKKININTREARQRLSLPIEENILLFFGEWRHEKGPDILAEHLTKINNSVYVVYAGSPVDFSREDLNTKFSKSGDNITTKLVDKFIPESEVEAYFTASDVVALPYRRKKGISGPLRIAAVTKVPVIAVSNSDIGNIVHRFEMGETFSLDDNHEFEQCLDKIINQSDNYTRGLSQYAHKQNWRTAGSQFEQVYNSVSDSTS